MRAMSTIKDKYRFIISKLLKVDIFKVVRGVGFAYLRAIGL
jgi:hypothetical protein